MTTPELLPRVNTGLQGQGRVTAHERVIDSLGRFHGLLRLVVDGDRELPDVALWAQMLPPEAEIQATWADIGWARRLVIFYRIK